MGSSLSMIISIVRGRLGAGGDRDEVECDYK